MIEWDRKRGRNGLVSHAHRFFLGLKIGSWHCKRDPMQAKKGGVDLRSLLSSLVTLVVTHSCEVNVVHSVLGRDALGMIVSEHLAEEVKSLVGNQLVVLRVNEFGPRLARDGVLGQKIFIVRVKGKSILVQVGVEFFGSEDLGNLDELIVVIATLEERLSLEDHAGEHAAERPNVQGVVVGLKVDQKLGSLEVAGSNTHIVLLARVVEFCKTPINETKFPVSMIDHDVVRLHIAMHDALRMAEVEGLQDLKHVVADVEVVEALIKLTEIRITSINELSDNGRGLRKRITYNVNELNDVDTALQGLEDLNLATNLVFLD